MQTDEIREKYLAFFESKGCVRRPSDVLVPHWDPSVLFTPAGMNQFKDHFLGKCKLEFTRATTCQKCLRTGDIDNVGRTAYHHTFFEMLGNFSFGDYFKLEAIVWAWEFLTSKAWLGIDPNRLTVSVYQDDDEAANIWMEQVGLPASRITRMGENDNFWPAGAPSHGPDGVCGPCSEIFYHTEKQGEVEIWNLVFTQFNRVGEPPDNLRPLPSKNIDTGMGLERAASVLQGADTNFHIDIFKPLVAKAAEICGQKYDPASETGRRLRRIADHLRACVFAIHENVYPGPDKEKYVVRRLLRRAVLDAHQMNVREPLLHNLASVVAQVMGRPYPELKDSVNRVADVIRREEASFLATIDSGLERIDRLFRALKDQGRVMVSGSEAADMYTTYGFPPELFETLAAEHNLTFDWDGYRAEMEKHGDKSGRRKFELFQTGPLDALKKAYGTTTFLGYDRIESPAKIVGIVAQDHLCEAVDEIGHAEPIRVVLDQTPFYGEGGGQVGDTGQITGEGFEFEVVDTLKDGGLLVHVGHLRQGRMKLGSQATARVDAVRRQAIRRAHSATHVLHYALQKHLGGHAQQRGSKVDRDLLRFDFTNPSAVTREQLATIEDEVNARILDAAPVAWQMLPLTEARSHGAMMLFGEKYPDEVRMVSMGGFSKELCGGTHVDNTAQIGLFRLVGEESVSAGTRRITALTGAAALADMRKTQNLLAEAAAALRVPLDKVPERAETLAKENRELKKQATAAPAKGDRSLESLLAGAEDIGGTKVIVAEVPAPVPMLRQYIDSLRKQAAPAAVLLAARDGDKVMLVAGVSRDLEQRGVSAAEWIRSPAALVGGSGGGRADMAQAGGKDPAHLAAALDEARKGIRDLLAASAAK
ncbi:MAG: alanine--tRNA ligase [Pirellulales bacterium]|nr:alanine--tRNA ligase [Pirellulales bacterium]